MQVYLWSNGMVMVFDIHGQVEVLQGPLEEVRERVLAEAPDGSTFHFGVWRHRAIEVPREQWARLRYDHATSESSGDSVTAMGSR